MAQRGHFLESKLSLCCKNWVTNIFDPTCIMNASSRSNVYKAPIERTASKSGGDVMLGLNDSWCRNGKWGWYKLK